MKGRPAPRNSLGAFLSFSLWGLTGFVAAVGVVVAPATSVAAEIGDIAVPLVAITVGFILAGGFISGWFIWLTGPFVMKLGTLIITTLRRIVVPATAPDSLATRRRNDGILNTPDDSPSFRRRLRTSCWKAGRWAMVLSLLWGCSIVGAAGGLSRHRHLVAGTKVQADSLIDSLAKYKQLHSRYPRQLEDLPDPVSRPYLGDGYIYQSVDTGEWCMLQYTVDPTTGFEWDSDTKRWTEIHMMLLPMY